MKQDKKATVFTRAPRPQPSLDHYKGHLQCEHEAPSKGGKSGGSYDEAGR